MSDKYGYIGIETLLNFCSNDKNHCVTPNDFMRMNRVKIDERQHGEWIEDIRSIICEVNDYYGYTDSMHMFKVLFDQKYHGWIKREISCCPCDTCKHWGEYDAVDPYGEPYCPIDHECENASRYEKKEGDENG